MLLNAADKSIEVYLAGATATPCPITAWYVDHIDTWGYPDSYDTETNGAAAVTVVAAPILVPPATNIQRQVKMITVHNSTQLGIVVYTQLNHASTARIMNISALAAGESLVYQNEIGFRIGTPTGTFLSDVSDRAARLLGVISGAVTTDALKANDLNIEAVSKDLQVDVKTLPAITGAVTTDALKAGDLSIEAVTKYLNVNSRWTDIAGTTYGYKQSDGLPRIESKSYPYSIAQGYVSGKTAWSKIGFNGALVAATEADIWSGTGPYVRPLIPDGWQVVSSSAGDEDTGVAIFSGASSGGTAISLVDNTKNFNAGVPVAIGDCIILDKSMDGGRTPEWGYVSAITSNTELAVSGGFSSGGTGFGVAGRNYYVVDKYLAATPRTGAHAVWINYLDGSFNSKSEIVILDGNAAVNTINVDMYRVNGMRVIATGSNNKSVGSLTLRLEGGAATVYTFISAGFTRARNIHYTVPIGKHLIITSMSVSYAYSHNSTHYCRVYLKANCEPTMNFNTQAIFYPYAEVAVSNSDVEKEFTIPLIFHAGDDVTVQALADYAGIATCVLRGWLE